MRSAPACFVISCAAWTAASAPVAAQTPIADGFYDDWAKVAPLATDPIGDNVNAGDISVVYAQSRGSVLYLRFDLGTEMNVQSGANGNDVPRVEIGLPSGDSLTLDLRGRTYYLNGNPGNWVSWSTLQLQTGPTHSDDEVEVRVDLSSQGVSQGQTVSINFSGSDALAQPEMFTLSQAPEPPTVLSTDKLANTDFRIASVNTLSTGLLSSNRGPRIMRLMTGMQPEIICFQEEYNSSASQVQSAIENADPFGDGATWNVHKNNDNVVSSRSTLHPLPEYNSKYAAAIVEFGPGDAVAVLSVHPKCCGYKGSFEDNQRIGETNGMIQTISELREAQIPGLESFADVPVVVTGDWNLVGSRIPLTNLEDNSAPSSPALAEWPIRHLTDDELHTWRGSSQGPGAFTPGRLDLVAYDCQGLVPRNGFVFDSARLDASTLATLGMLSTDSAATDHFMLVTDFEFGSSPTCAGDTNGDGAVDSGDIAFTIFRLGQTGTPGDVEGDADANGVVDSADLGFIIFRLGITCGT